MSESLNNIAVIYRGMYARLRPRPSNFFQIKENNEKFFLNEIGNCDIFCETNSFDETNDNELRKCMNWKHINFNNSNRSCMDSVMNSLKIYDFTQYEFIFNIRFGLQFNKPLSMFNLDGDKFNCLWKEPRRLNNNGNTRVSDHLFAFPTKYLNNFNNINLDDESISYGRGKMIKPADKAHHIMHYLNLDIENEVNFMLEGEHWSGGRDCDPEGMSYIEVHRGKMIQ